MSIQEQQQAKEKYYSEAMMHKPIGKERKSIEYYQENIEYIL